MKHPSPRLIVAAMTLALLGGTAAAASAAGVDAPVAKKHIVCLINQDPTPNSPQHGLCLVVDDPKLPTLP
jgi:hypothetical protein